MKRILTSLILILAAVTLLSFRASAQGELSRYSPEKCGLSLELPVQPAPVIKTPIPKNLKGKILYRNMSTTQAGDVAVVYSHMSAIEYLQPKSVAQGAINGIVSNSGKLDYQITTEPSTDTQAPLKGTFKVNNVEMEINGLVLSKEKNTWSVVCLYKASDRKAQELAQRILASIKLDGVPCPEK